MSYIQFDKTQLINLQYSLNREMIRSNRSGAYASTTIINSNTRKYHGLLVVPQPEVDNELHVLISSLDETIIQHDTKFNLALHKYPNNNWQPKGHKYIRDFESDPIPTLIYRVGGVVLKRESLLSTNDDRLLIRYTLLDAHSPTTLRFAPFLAFRNRHTLSKANLFANTTYQTVNNGIAMRLYSQYSALIMQLSKEPAYVHAPNWNYNIEYIREQERGYEYHEDLLVPGYFELPIQKGESIVFSAGLSEVNPDKLQAMFSVEVKSRTPRSNFKNCLINSAKQFVVENNGNSGIIAGYPWYGQRSRDTFVALPGLTLEIGDLKRFRSVMNKMTERMVGPFFIDPERYHKPNYESVDTPLWFFRAIHAYLIETKDYSGAWTSWGEAMTTILESYSRGTDYKIRMNDLGLIEAGDESMALTWMDGIVDGKPVTPRPGMAVEVNALWYNALSVYFSITDKLGVENDKLNPLRERLSEIGDNFVKVFWNKKRGSLYDFVYGKYIDEAVRPNQVIATALPYTPLDEDKIKSILHLLKTELLTPRGLRSLCPHHPLYKGEYRGNAIERDLAAHQGVAWPWLFEFFAAAWLKIYESCGLQFIKEIFEDFEQAMEEEGIGTISELYEGNPPFRGGGATSQALSVAALIKVGKMLDNMSVN